MHQLYTKHLLENIPRAPKKIKPRTKKHALGNSKRATQQLDSPTRLPAPRPRTNKLHTPQPATNKTRHLPQFFLSCIYVSSGTSVTIPARVLQFFLSCIIVVPRHRLVDVHGAPSILSKLHQEGRVIYDKTKAVWFILQFFQSCILVCHLVYVFEFKLVPSILSKLHHEIEQWI